jgi:PIN domain nuclease of toxin-antitoxin system
MRLLLDTHTFLWWDNEPDKLSERALALCRDPSNVLMLSVVSVGEMQIKHQAGKLDLSLPLAALVAGQMETNKIQVLPITMEHVLALEALPSHHKDPFDRLLVAQAVVEGVMLVSRDPLFNRYPVTAVW